MKTQLGGPTPQEYQTLLAEKEALLKDLEDAKQREQELKQRVRLLFLLHTKHLYNVYCIKVDQRAIDHIEILCQAHL